MTACGSASESWKIIEGEDRNRVLQARKSNGDSYDLTGVTEIRARFRKKDGSILELRLSTSDITIVDAVRGRFGVSFTELQSAQLLIGAGQDFSVIFDSGPLATVIYLTTTFTADHPGSDGNSILLTFDGIKTVQQVVDAWNRANPSIQVKFTPSNQSTMVHPVGTAQLAGGVSGRRKMTYRRALSVEKQPV